MYVLFVEKPGQAPPQVTKETVEKPLFEPKPEGVDRVELTRKGEPTVTLVKEATGDEWNIETPIKAPARKYDAEGVVRAVADMKYVKEFGARTPSDRARRPPGSKSRRPWSS